MILEYGSWEKLHNDIKRSKKKIIVYGAGMIGQVIVPYWLDKLDIYQDVLYYVDADYRKKNKTIRYGSKEYIIEDVRLLESEKREFFILITNSHCQDVIRYLDTLDNLNSTIVYLIPQILIDSSHKKNDYIFNRKNGEKIPKILHYCWFSRNDIPDSLKKCIESWHKFCPDYEIKQWNEDNYDINKTLYTKEAYERKKWGFVPDIARLDILFEYGGIYIDTDVELIKPLDELLYLDAFCGVEKWGNINFGQCSGAVPHHPMIKELLDYRKNEKFVYSDGTLNLNTCGIYETPPFIAKGYKPDNSIQNVEGVTIFSSDFFSPYDYISGETELTENTFGIHHFSSSWLTVEDKKNRELTQQSYKKIIERMKKVR